MLYYYYFRKIANLYNKNRDKALPEDAVPMWILTNPIESSKPLLLSVQSDQNHFARGLVSYVESVNLDDVDLDQLLEDYASQEELSTNLVSY